MNLSLVWKLFLYLIPYFSTIKAHNNVIFLIKDYLDYYDHFTKIYTCTCWEKDVERQLERYLEKVSLHSRYNVSDSRHIDLHQSLAFVDTSCHQFKFLMEKFHDGRIFNPNQQWLLLIKSVKEIQNYFFPINSNVYSVEETSYGYSIKKIYKTSVDSKLMQLTFGNWTINDGYRQALQATHNGNLMREKIHISYVVRDIETINHLEDYQYNILTDTMTKLNYALLQHLSNMINATKVDTFRRHFLEDGMIEDLASGNFDIGATPLELLKENVDKFSVLGKTAIVENKFIFRTTPHSYISNVFTLPFDSYVWYSSFGLIAVIFFISYAVVYWEWKDPIFKRFISPKLCLRPHPLDIFLMEVGSAAQQGFESEPRSNSGRIVFIFTLISFMFLYTSFSANIVAILQSTTESLNSLDALFESRIPVGFKENISMDYFNELKYENKSKEFYSKLHKPLFLPIDRGIKMVQKEFFAFYADTSESYKYVKDWFMESEKCSLREIAFKNTYVDYWLFMKKNSHYKDIFKAGMNKIHHSGIRDREFKRFFTPKPQCDSAGGSFESVGLVDSYGAFLVMLAGLAFSIVLFLAETLWVSYNIHKIEEITF